MNNFLQYIEDDIDLKTAIFKDLPTKTKTNIKNKKKTLIEFQDKYKSYLEDVTKYIEVKANTIGTNDNVVLSESKIDEYVSSIKELKYLAKLLNPITSPYEKLGIDNLFFEMNHYSEFDFVRLNYILKELLEKYESAGIIFTPNSFKVTPYVYEYMSEFLRESKNDNISYFRLQPIFEKLYWESPSLLKHIELAFRVIYLKNIKMFDRYVSKKQDEMKYKLNIVSYSECIKLLKKKHLEYLYASKESVGDIVDLAVDNVLDLKDYITDSKFIEAADSALFIKDDSRTYEGNKENDFEEFTKLYNVLVEYKSYKRFEPFMEHCRNLIENYKLPKPYKEIKETQDKLENGIKMLNQIYFDELPFTKRVSLVLNKSEMLKKPKKQLKIDIANYADKLLSIYLTLDGAQFYKVIKSVATEYVTMDEFLNVFRDFEYFKKKELKEAYNVGTYDELMVIVEEFDSFCNNPSNILIPTVPVYQEYDVAKVIVDKYRINNMNISMDSLGSNNIDTLLSYVEYYIRNAHVTKCDMTFDKLWFIAEVRKIMNKRTTEK